MIISLLSSVQVGVAICKQREPFEADQFAVHDQLQEKEEEKPMTTGTSRSLFGLQKMAPALLMDNLSSQWRDKASPARGRALHKEIRAKRTRNPCVKSVSNYFTSHRVIKYYTCKASTSSGCFSSIANYGYGKCQTKYHVVQLREERKFLRIPYKCTCA